VGEMTISAALSWGRMQLEPGSDTASLDAQVLLCAVLACERSYLYTWPDRCLEPAQWQQFQQWIKRRAEGCPVAHLTGIREFWSLPLAVSAATLIPRPDTEVLVEAALARLPAGECDILDLGTGTGAIALALASERPDARVLAVDRVEDAVALARANAEQLRLNRVEVRQSDWFAGLGGGQQFDMIVSNPPYIDLHDPHLEQGDVRFEPSSALVAADEGLADLLLIVSQAPDYLKAGGWLLLEHGYRQGPAVRRALSARGFDQVQTIRDYGGQERVTAGCWR